MALRGCIMLKENSLFWPVRRERKRKRLPSKRGILGYFAPETADYRDCSQFYSYWQASGLLTHRNHALWFAVAVTVSKQKKNFHLPHSTIVRLVASLKEKVQKADRHAIVSSSVLPEAGNR